MNDRSLPFIAAILLLTLRFSAAGATEDDFRNAVARLLPVEQLYDYHKRLSTSPVHTARRDRTVQAQPGEMALPDSGWKIVLSSQGSPLLRHTALDFQDYLNRSMGVQAEISNPDSVKDWKNLRQSIVAGTRAELQGCGEKLRSSKDYEIITTDSQVVVCGYDDRGAMHGLYHLEAVMNLREAPFLRARWKTVRHSLHATRMVQSWMGWMDFPDSLLAQMVHDGIDAILAPVYANPNGDRTSAETSTDFYARLEFRVREMDPRRMRDLLNRASRFGVKVYSPIIYQYQGTSESEAGLRRLVRDILKDFPDIRGYMLLTEGFWYGKWREGRTGGDEAVSEWIRQWTRAVSIVTEECHRVNPAIEILPWDYNIVNRRDKAHLKQALIRQLPADTIPMLSWENGKSFEIDGLEGHLGDYSISHIGPAEATEAQIAEARRRGMKVYCRTDTFVCGAQLETVPYHPFPQQWHARYKALEKYGIDGTLETWSTGYTPNFMSELRAWYCWSDAPELDELLKRMARRAFGDAGAEKAMKAWELFSQAIRLLPDTGSTMGTSAAVSNPLFFQQPPPRTPTFYNSWTDHDKWMGYFGGQINPYWPFTLSRLTFFPDFTNRTNKAELYARSVSGIRTGGDIAVLPIFLKYVRLSADRMSDGLKLYREAALSAPSSKRAAAVRDVSLMEQSERMLRSEHAILEFENLRLQLALRPEDADVRRRMEEILREEIARTELSLLAASRDSRLGFQFESGYNYTPFSLREKLELLRETLKEQLAPQRRN